MGGHETDETQGVSRRDLIAKGVAAGGLVWAAPVLMSGVAGAQTIPCCGTGTPVTIKVAEVGGVNCGVACLSSRADLNFDCPDDLVDCLGDLQLVVGDFTEGGSDTAHITLSPGIGLIAVGVKASNRCYFAECPCFASSQNDATCENTCTTQSGNPCDAATIIPPNRIWVVPNSPGAGQTSIFVNTHAAPDATLNHVELSICVSPEITALCP